LRSAALVIPIRFSANMTGRCFLA